jgi:hypothetical protein
MAKSFHIAVLFLFSVFISNAQSTNVSDYIAINLSTYQKNGQTHYSPMPELKANSELSRYKWRFEFLIMNAPAIHNSEALSKRQELFNLSDSSEIKNGYLQEFQNDPYFMKVFTETMQPFVQSDFTPTQTFTKEELMKAASIFFYCDQVNPDTTIQTHICIGINGFKEVNWEKDYTILTAFCCEAILFDMYQDKSPIDEAFSKEKQLSCKTWRGKITTLDNYLENVKKDVFERMENNAVLKKTLLSYYKRNKSNLTFRIE